MELAKINSSIDALSELVEIVNLNPNQNYKSFASKHLDLQFRSLRPPLEEKDSTVSKILLENIKHHKTLFSNKVEQCYKFNRNLDILVISSLSILILIALSFIVFIALKHDSQISNLLSANMLLALEVLLIINVALIASYAYILYSRSAEKHNRESRINELNHLMELLK